MSKTLPYIVVGILLLSGLGAVAGSESEREEFVYEIVIFSQPIIREKGDYVSLVLMKQLPLLWKRVNQYYQWFQKCIHFHLVHR